MTSNRFSKETTELTPASSASTLWSERIFEQDQVSQPQCSQRDCPSSLCCGDWEGNVVSRTKAGHQVREVGFALKSMGSWIDSGKECRNGVEGRKLGSVGLLHLAKEKPLWGRVVVTSGMQETSLREAPSLQSCLQCGLGLQK
jgi:hypothetical protein